MRVLIAEDDKALGLFLSRGLEADGYQVRVANDGAAAVEAFRREMPDLTILDLNMPIKDGEQVLEELRAMDADLPVLVLTARQEVETRVRCLDRGADDLMIKPFSLHELRARCRALLRRKREARCCCVPAIWNWTAWSTPRTAPASRSCSPIRNSPCSST
jgi:DNA-binding response OmpR family regulator